MISTVVGYTVRRVFSNSDAMYSSWETSPGVISKSH
jgi:hypothetical protein